MLRLAGTAKTVRLHKFRCIPSSPALRFYSSQPPTTPPSSAIEENHRAKVQGQEGFWFEDDDGLQIDDGQEHPNLMYPDPILDLHESITFPPTKNFPHAAKVTVYNDPSLFDKETGEAEDALSERTNQDAKEDVEDDGRVNPLSTLPLSIPQIMTLHRYPILTRRITQQTGKGKIHRVYSMMIVGDGDGLVGLGEGKADEVPEAQTKALAQAVRNMDYVERFESRTIFTEMDTKLGATRIIMRPRPVGFGLRCNPNIHQVLKAAGIKDISAKVWGSRNKINVVKACFRMIQAGHSPTLMGDGLGGGARKLNKGRGIVSREEVERARGRNLVDLRTW
jgi:small subunit ribosomal protein S5